ncbi:MAG: hypothetical protein EOP24_30135 [Hyphomicrobiales bacterium]|nr:MAG: hypothetical protein EOP24_30135 [Hyphomicrobiales bacterium]
MKMGIVVLCRYGSERLPGKILRELHGRPLLSYIVERVRKGASACPVVVATSDEAPDDPIAAYCRRAGIECFRGSLGDVAQRFLDCAESHGWDFAVRINGDNLFVDPATLNAMLAVAQTDAFDFVTNVPGRTFPFGMSVEIVRTSFYRSAMRDAREAPHREHVTSWLYDHPGVGRRYVYQNRTCPEAAGLQLAVDTAEDFELASRILAAAGPYHANLGLAEIAFLARNPRRTSPWKGSAGPLLIAEIGGNHEGNFEVAKAMTLSAIESGVDCVKFQLYRGDSLVSPVESPDRHRHFQRFELPRERHIELARMCRDAGVSYLSSVWDLEMLDWIDEYMDIYKIGSGDLTAWPFLKEFARRGKPLLLSTGLATMDEVLQTVAQVQAVDDRYRSPDMFCIMQCTSMYPIPDQEANLRVMDSLRASTGLAVGYSDHTVGMDALCAAAAMGAEALEFHFTDTREGKTFRDHQVSLVADEVRALKKQIARITAFRGDAVKRPQESELAVGHEVSFRRGVYARRTIAAGETLTERDLVLLRPAHGTDARDTDTVVGATALCRIEPFQSIRPGVHYVR